MRVAEREVVQPARWRSPSNPLGKAIFDVVVALPIVVVQPSADGFPNWMFCPEMVKSWCK